jgi:hypothetical protein
MSGLTCRDRYSGLDAAIRNGEFAKAAEPLEFPLDSIIPSGRNR